MIFIACLLKSRNHLIYVSIKIVVFLRKVLTLIDLSISHELSHTFCLQPIKKHRLVKVWKAQIRRVFNNLRLRKRFALLCQRNRPFRHTKWQTFSTSRCNQNSHFCNQNSYSHDFDLHFRLRLRCSFDFRLQITFVASVSIVSIFAMICSIIHDSIIDTLRIADRWEKYERNSRFETKFVKKRK